MFSWRNKKNINPIPTLILSYDLSICVLQLFGHKKSSSMPIFASGLTMLEPTKGPISSNARSLETLIDTSKPDETQIYTQVGETKILYVKPNIHKFNLFHSLGKFNWRQIYAFLHIFPRKQDLTFPENCLCWRQFAWNVKSCFLGKLRKIFQDVICWKFYPEC